MDTSTTAEAQNNTKNDEAQQNDAYENVSALARRLLVSPRLVQLLQTFLCVLLHCLHVVVQILQFFSLLIRLLRNVGSDLIDISHDLSHVTDLLRPVSDDFRVKISLVLYFDVQRFQLILCLLLLFSTPIDHVLSGIRGLSFDDTRGGQLAELTHAVLNRLGDFLHPSHVCAQLRLEG